MKNTEKYNIYLDVDVVGNGFVLRRHSAPSRGTYIADGSNVTVHHTVEELVAAMREEVGTLTDWR